MTADGTFEGWRVWLTEFVDPEITELHHRRHMWQGVRDLVQGHEEPDADWYLFFAPYTRMYIDGQSIGVRRQGDRDKDVVSLVRLLESILTEPKVMTRARFISLFSQEPDNDTFGFFLGNANELFDMFSGPGQAHVDPAVIRAMPARSLSARAAGPAKRVRPASTSAAKRANRLPMSRSTSTLPFSFLERAAPASCRTAAAREGISERLDVTAGLGSRWAAWAAS